MKAVGIDGCKHGWVAACYDEEKVLLFKNIDDVVAYYGNDSKYLIDIPIGLASKKMPVRTCEKQARTVLPVKRKSSVFAVPCRETLSAFDYPKGNEINRSILGCGISKQSWFILPKIKEIDDLLFDKPDIRSIIKESHPEIAFQFLNGGFYLMHTKKSEEGRAERLAILNRHNTKSEQLFEEALRSYKRKEVAEDDILDALCLSLTQSLIISQPASRRAIPMHPEFDERGIGMGIYYAVIAP